MLRFEYWEREVRILGILIVATEPVAANRRWYFLSCRWSEALRGGSGRSPLFGLASRPPD